MSGGREPSVSNDHYEDWVSAVRLTPFLNKGDGRRLSTSFRHHIKTVFVRSPSTIFKKDLRMIPITSESLAEIG